MGCFCKRREIVRQLTEAEIAALLENERKKNIKMDDYDEDKAKELVKDLLSSDLKFYRDQLYVVINLDSKEFRKLFEGDSDYIYNVKDQDKFKKLALKFENFSVIMNEWYKKDKKYHVCLKQLWKNFINLYDLNSLDEEHLEKKLKSTNYKNWEDDIKEEFKLIIKNSIDLTEKFKVFLSMEFKELDSVIKNLETAKKNVAKAEETQKKKNYCIKENVDNIISKILETVFPVYLEKTQKNEENNNTEKNKGFSKNKLSQIIKTVAKSYITGEVPKDFNLKQSLNEISSLIEEFGGIKTLQPLIQNNLKSIIDNKFTAYGILGLSYINLCYNIVSTYVFLDSSKTKINELEQRLDAIKKQFENHQSQVKVLPIDKVEDIEYAMKKIEEIRLNFADDKYQIEILIQDINKEISEQKSQKKKGFFKIFSNLGMMGLNAVLAKNTQNTEYGISAIFNGLSAATDVTAIVQIGKNIKKLNKLLEEAKEEETKIVEAINELSEKYKNIQLKVTPT